MPAILFPLGLIWLGAALLAARLQDERRRRLEVLDEVENLSSNLDDVERQLDYYLRRDRDANPGKEA